MGLLDALRRKTPTPQFPIRRSEWNGYVYRFGEDQQCLVSFDVQACAPEHQLAQYTGRRVIIFAGNGEVDPSGIPMQPASDRLRGVEDTLLLRLDADGVACWHVGSQTYSGMREVIFEVADVAAFEKTYSAYAGNRSDMKLMAFTGWQFFNEKIHPGVVGHNHISNRGAIESLKRAGSKLESNHSVEHCFLGTAEALTTVESVLFEKGLRRTKRVDESLTMTHSIGLNDQDLIDAITLFMRDSAEECGAQYDGWNAMVVN